MFGNIRRLICCAVVFTLLLGNAAYAKPYDVVDDTLSEKIQLLSALGIMYENDGSNFRPDDTVKRRELARFLCSLKNLDVKCGIDAGFKDVDADDGDFNAICTAVSNSLMVGNDDCMFLPDEEVAFTEAVKTVVCVLGFEDIAVLNGGYPIGYMTVAAQQKLLSGIDNVGALITRGQLATLFYNALHSEILVNAAVGERISSETQEGRTLLYEVFDCRKSNGVVRANENTSLIGSGVSKDCVKIDDTVYRTGTTNISGELGKIVDFYYTEDKDTFEKTVIMYTADERYFVTIDASKISKSGTSRERLEVYTDGRRADTYAFAANSDLIYNGCFRKFDSIEYLSPDLGEVTICDTNKDGKYDVINVVSYELAVVDFVTDNGNSVLLKNGKGIINLSDDFSKVKMIKNGKNFDSTELKEWDVLNIAKSPSEYKPVCTIVVTDNRAAGKINGFSFSENGYIDVDGNSYEISDYYIDNYGKSLTVGKTGIFMLDIGNRIVAINGSLNSRSIAFLYKVSIKDNVDEELGFMMFLPDNSWKTYIGADKITFNDSVMTKKEVYGRLLCKGDANGVKIDDDGYMVNLFGGYIKYADENNRNEGFISGKELGTAPFGYTTDRQIISYELDENDKISSIQTVDGSKDSDALTLLGSYTGESGSKGKIQWRECTDGFFIEDWYATQFVSFYADEETTVFLIPFDTPENKDAYGIKKGIRSNQDLGYYAEVYTFRDRSFLDSAPYMMSSSGSSDTDDLEIVVVDDVVHCVDEDGQEYYILKCFYHTKMSEYKVKDISAIQVDGKVVSCGDVLKMNINNDGSIKKVRTGYKNGIIFNASHDFKSQIGVDGYYRDVTQSYTGYVSDVNYDKKRIAINIGKKDEHGNDPSVGMWRYWAQTPVIVVSKRQNIISIGGIEDICIGDFVVAVLRYTCTQAIVVYKD